MYGYKINLLKQISLLLLHQLVHNLDIFVRIKVHLIEFGVYFNQPSLYYFQKALQCNQELLYHFILYKQFQEQVLAAFDHATVRVEKYVRQHDEHLGLLGEIVGLVPALTTSKSGRWLPLPLLLLLRKGIDLLIKLHDFLAHLLEALEALLELPQASFSHMVQFQVGHHIIRRHLLLL